MNSPGDLTSNERAPRHALWDHLQEQHGLVLLESELDDIIALARATLPPSEVAWLIEMQFGGKAHWLEREARERGYSDLLDAYHAHSR